MISDKGLNFFDECAAEYLHLCCQEEQCTFSLRGENKMHTPGTIAKLQRMKTKMNKNGAISEVRILVVQVIL